ncbi:MAG: beta strand repeat-containing protein [Allosphingosinicella sp.]
MGFSRRTPLLLGTSLLASAALVSPALAQNECGAPSGGTVTCPAGNYPNGIDYAPVDDLTVVLEPGVTTDQTVELTGSSSNQELRLEGQVNTLIRSSQSGYGAGEGVNVDSTFGTAFVAVDDVATTGLISSRGIAADSKYGTTVIADTVETAGATSDGISAESKYGDVSVTVNSVTTDGADSEGIEASGSTIITIDSGTVTTGGDNSTGILAVQTYSEVGYGTYDTGSGGEITAEALGLNGGVSITSGDVATGGANSPGIDAYAATGDVEVFSGEVTTLGVNSTGIFAQAAVGFVTVESDSVTTAGPSAFGIDARARGFVTIDSGTVGTTGDFATGIVAAQLPGGTGGISITSTAVTTEGDFAEGINGGAVDDLSIVSGSVETAGDNATGIVATSDNGSASVDSGTVTTAGGSSRGITAYGVTTVTVTSETVSTEGVNSAGIIAVQLDGGEGDGSDIVADGALAPLALGPNGGVSVTSGDVTTIGDDSPGIDAYAATGDVEVFSTGTISTAGADSEGLLAEAPNGFVTVQSNAVTTAGENSAGILANGEADVTVASNVIETGGDGSLGIAAASKYGEVSVTSGTVETAGAYSIGIAAIAPFAQVTVDSGIVSTEGDTAVGIVGISIYDSVQIVSENVATIGDGAIGIAAFSKYGDVVVDSGSVVTSGEDAIGIFAVRSGFKYGDGNGDGYSGGEVTSLSSGLASQAIVYGGSVIVTSGSVSTSGDGATGIYADNRGELGAGGSVVVESGSVTTLGDYANGITALAGSDKYGEPGTVTVTSGNVSTAGYGSIAILAEAPGDATVTSATITTGGDFANGIDADSVFGNVSITSGSVTTAGDYSSGIYAEAPNGDVEIVSTGTVRTGGDYSYGIYALGRDTVTINSNAVITTGAGAIGIFAVQLDGGEGDGEEIIEEGALLPAQLGPGGGISITSGSVTTSGPNSPGIDAYAAGGDVEIFSTGTVATSGTGSPGILAESANGFVAVDAVGVTATGTASDAIVVTSATTSTVTIRGLVQATNGFEVQAEGGPATVNTTAPGIIRGAVDLTAGADRVNNAGQFDAIGTSQFGAGTDAFVNTGTTRSINGAAVLAGLESFTSSGLVELRDGAVGDTLNVTGAFIGAGGNLGVDANFDTATADVLITGPATGSTALQVALAGTPRFNFNGILVVDATAGTSPTAVTLGSISSNSPFVRIGLRFDAPNNNFLLVGLPDQPVFETALTQELALNVWYQSADAVSAQLDTSRDRLPDNVSALRTEGGFGLWAQLYAGEFERSAAQPFAVGTPSLFDVSYEQQFLGLQGGADYQFGETIVGITAGFGEADADFVASFNQLQLDSVNLGAYATARFGGFFVNGLIKVDWIDATTEPGGLISAEFDGTAFGARVSAGYRFALGDVYLEPAASLSWVSLELDDYTVGGASVAFDDLTSFRGAAGVRLGWDVTMGTGIASPFLGLYVVDEFNGDGRNDFTLGTVTLNLTQDAPGTWGEVRGGVSFVFGAVEAFMRGELEFDGDVDGIAGRLGARIRF